MSWASTDTDLPRSGFDGSIDSRRAVDVYKRQGHLQHVKGRAQRRDATKRSTDRFAEVVMALESRGVTVALRTGGGTGTAAIDVELGVLNELQCLSLIHI